MADIFSNPSNWAALGFIAFVALVGKRGWVFLTSWLDGRSAEIKARLDEALKLREEAAALLASYERKQRDAEQDAKEIIARAKEDAVRVAAEAAAALEATVQRRQQSAIDRIAQAEAKALKEVSDTAIDIAIRSAQRLIVLELDEKKADQMVDEAIAELDKKLH